MVLAIGPGTSTVNTGIPSLLKVGMLQNDIRALCCMFETLALDKPFLIIVLAPLSILDPSGIVR